MGLRNEELLPDYNFRIDSTQDLERFTNEVLQPVLDLACAEAERWIDQQSIDTMDSKTINALLGDLGNPFRVAYTLTLERRRLLALVLIDIYQAKGTGPGLIDLVRALTGIEIIAIVSPVTVPAWLLGVEVLGDTPADLPPADPEFTDLAILGQATDFVRYSFKVEVGSVLTQDERDVITEIVNLAKPAHTHFLGFIEPTAPSVIDHWELNLSALHATGESLEGDEVDLHQ